MTKQEEIEEFDRQIEELKGKRRELSLKAKRAEQEKCKHTWGAVGFYATQTVMHCHLCDLVEIR